MRIIVITIICTMAVSGTIGCIIATMREEYAIYWACGIMYPFFLVLLYPIRAIHRYNSSCNYFKKHGISKMAYFFGKRVKED